MANIITGIRIGCALLILFFPAFSKWFYAFYLLGGLTDAIDGTAARKTGRASEFGAKFDTLADLIFAVCVFIRVVNALYMPKWILIWIGAVALIKAVNIAGGFILHHRFITVHSALNKICGVLVFFAVAVLGFFSWEILCPVVVAACVAASAAALMEGYSIFRNQSDDIEERRPPGKAS